MLSGGGSRIAREAEPCSLLEQPHLPGAGDGLGAPFHVELLEDAAVVALDRVQGQEEPRADLLVRKALGDQAQHLELAWAERFGGDEGPGVERAGGRSRASASKAANSRAA